MRTRVVVADEAQADLYELGSKNELLRRIGGLRDPKARLHERDLVTDRPGRVFDRAPGPGARRGTVARHGTGGERSAHRQGVHRFAARIVQRLERDRIAGHFEALVLIAGPRFLGELRAGMDENLRRLTVAEVPRDLVHRPLAEVLSHLPDEVRWRAG